MSVLGGIERWANRFLSSRARAQRLPQRTRGFGRQRQAQSVRRHVRVRQVARIGSVSCACAVSEPCAQRFGRRPSHLTFLWARSEARVLLSRGDAGPTQQAHMSCLGRSMRMGHLCCGRLPPTTSPSQRFSSTLRALIRRWTSVVGYGALRPMPSRITFVQLRARISMSLPCFRATVCTSPGAESSEALVSVAHRNTVEEARVESSWLLEQGRAHFCDVLVKRDFGAATRRMLAGWAARWAKQQVAEAASCASGDQPDSAYFRLRIS